MKKIFTLITICMVSISVWAHDVEIDGIYYNLLSKAKLAEVTYAGSWYGDYTNEYIGAVIIPSSITISGVDYSVTSIGTQILKIAIVLLL